MGTEPGWLAGCGDTPRVLVIEDDDDVRYLLRVLLEEEGYAVTEADNGADGLARASTDRPDLVLLDRRMPHLDGLQVLKSLKANPLTTNVPVIFLTALGDEPDRLDGIQAGAWDYLTKPFQREDLRNRIANVLRRSSSPSDPDAETTVGMDKRETWGSSSRPRPSTTALERALVGTVVADKYLIEGVLGQGGMATVFRVRHRLLGRYMALKLIRADRSESLYARRRFLREAQLVSTLVHPNIVLVRDFGVTQEGALYLAMDLCTGRPLRALMTKARRVPPAQAVRLMSQVLAALEYSHSQRIMHRDIKPENIIVDDDGHVRLLDFGLAKLLDSSNEDREQTDRGWRVGTPLYMSPEQASGVDIDQRADLFAVGMVLYELLAGQCPYDLSGGVELVLQRRRHAAPQALRNHVQVPHGLEAAVMKSLRLAEDRWESATAFREALQSSLG